ncbi:hypothetical protein E1161_04210 [Saccharopolyspora aridisoli]|uniref:Uncharacterized protein n=1 Tax=Saccharopolyspora aridisoli TaxID=2530385 RepID=A0A4R4USQ0_9PSEU|nr:hypothetical protein [Saccharopolyspora aridisoli]TDC95398.1 hypothetical protein E1161_04210 [Saccharopolyspora aridisoli]
MSNDEFAAHLGIGLRTVAGWHEKPNRRPQSEMQRTLDTALAQEDDAIKARFAELVKDPTDAPAEPAVDEAAAADAEKRLSADPDIGAALEWLDAHAGWTPGTARKEVATRLARLDVSELEARASRRGRVDQRSVAEVLGKYYVLR